MTKIEHSSELDEEYPVPAEAVDQPAPATASSSCSAHSARRRSPPTSPRSRGRCSSAIPRPSRSRNARPTTRPSCR